MEEQKDVVQNPSPALTDAIANSSEAQEAAQAAVETTETQETQTPPAKQDETQEQQQEEPRVPYSRFKDVIEEKNWYKQQLEKRLEPQQTIQQPETNQYANMTPEEERFNRYLDDKIERRAKVIADQKFQEVVPLLEAGKREFARLKVEEFRSKHPDVKSGSPEEMAVAQRIQMGYTPDDAYWSVMGPTKTRNVVEAAKQQVKKEVKQKIDTKKQANVETSNSIKTPPAKQSWREKFEANWNAAMRGELS